MALVGPLAAQTPATPHPDVPAAFDVAGLHLVLSEEAQRLVQQKADGLCRHQPSFQARVDLADASFPIIDRVLKEEGVPLDFRYLALQESALVGDARSAHQAVGYWQLKQETATGLGLLVNEAVDERQHLTASTRAAARYLARNNTSLHNWLNALLSYNTGLGGVQPYTLPTDGNATEMAITEATSPYVLMFLAQKLAFEPACGQNPGPALRLQEFPAVAGQSLAAQALTLHVDSADLARNNHWLLAPAVPADRPYTLIVPVGDITQAAGIVANQRLQSSQELLTMPIVAANAAEVRLNDLRALIALPGETPADLARRGNQRLGEFLHHNELTAFDPAVPGRPYYLESKRDEAAVEYYVLLPGETIFDVAQKYGMRQKAILVKNRLSRNDELRPGRLLWMQHTRPREVAAEYRTLPEGAALERLARPAAPTDNDALVKRATETAVALRDAAPEGTKVKVKIKVKNGGAEPQQAATEDRDGWGETLSAAAVAAAVAPAPVPAPTSPEVVPEAAPAADFPIVRAPTTARLPPPAAAPAPAPLTDEPRPEPTAMPALGEVAPTPAPVALPAPIPSPARPVIPASPRVVVAAPVAKPVATSAAAESPEVSTHRVKPGETVYSISRHYQIPPATLIALNHLAPPAGLTVGQLLVLKSSEPLPVAAGPAVVAPAPRPAIGSSPALYVPKAAAPLMASAQHTVAVGETLYSISKRYLVSVADLQAWNGKPDTSVKIGEVLRVAAGGK